MVESENTIVLEGVPIVTPNRDVVASRLSFEVGVGEATLCLLSIVQVGNSS